MENKMNEKCKICSKIKGLNGFGYCESCMNADGNVIEFLQQSNAIEQVYDADSLFQAKVAWDYLVKQKKMTPAVVLKTHAILMKNQALAKNEIGAYRLAPVWVGGREGLPYIAIPEAIEYWCEQMNRQDQVRIKDKGREDNYEYISRNLHVDYETIHPFVDGNGRTGRLFMNWWRLTRDLPILIIKADWPKKNGEQVNYYKWFNKS